VSAQGLTPQALLGAKAPSWVRTHQWSLTGLLFGAALGLLAAKGSMLGVLALIGAGLVGVALATPQLTIYAVVLSILMDSMGTLDINVSFIPITISKLVVGGSLLLWFVHASFWRKPMFAWYDFSWGFVAVLTSMTVSLAQRSNPYYAMEGVGDVATVVMLAILLHYIMAVVNTVWLRRIQVGFAFFALFFLLAALASGFGVERNTASFRNPNEFGTVVLLVGLASLGVFSSLPRSWIRSLALLLLCSSMVVCVNQSGSRGTLITLLVLTPGIIWVLRRDMGLLLMVSAAVVVLIPIFVDVEYLIDRTRPLWEAEVYRPSGLGQSSIESRLGFATLAVELFRENPIWGVGVQGFIGRSAEYFPLNGGRDVHNAYLQIAVEQGLVGITAHLYLLYTLLRWSWARWAGAVSAQQRMVLTGYVLALLSYALVNVTSGKLMTFAIGYFVLGLTLVTLHLASVAPQVGAFEEEPT